MYDLATSILEKDVPCENNFTNKYKDSLVKDDYLEEKLKSFRKEKSSKMHVPAYFIFTDKEMQQIIKNKPKTIVELKKLNILSEIKFKLHAQEIITLITQKY